MDKLKVMQRIMDCGIVAVVRADSPDQALKIADAVKAGGVEAIEITMTVPGAIDVIRELKKAYPKGEILIGAGTVLDPETARAAMLAGAEFFVSPYFNPEMVKLCNRYQKVTMPGAMSIKEVVEVMESGADFVKLFPGSAFGPSMVKAIMGPLPYAPIIPTGGVSLENVGEWIKAGCVAVGVGGELTKGAKKGNYEEVQETARKFVEAIKAARN
ncbi:MAG: 2-dehydro-3-deoxyphosphogluconate aldolase / (4S)-4-hydroxy-2-oxoglutarate aldolase [Thermoanaerobacteraceae bacterium]|jgi:2-dehydro-3-deoxyphosphogluconate aldolase/(4S)-4-hydroxy-2-oxoglutarate aldolase|nr:2-dehydro-3-deoxyphosphogluconate aldolase / (4S)-4-hydroxy-2-oxoglutarate aldolase [Thermoanaerobacteraceae bacterium]MDN5301369.1 2-dehydro-3-deoxyphosphogluconate aldolase / (4S)-4-hydroxy-2-oxoglutarate aldolase [Thermoanaerobacteraceae bacterium]MDN5313365.1 2-dehydro-3-deoxyphosphogluconate aldolase / (4S)-4-hydroxy-2-oxoglutarate aldolase [Thermoanaerobacteraceae bacterium]RKL61831.1 bifunctional 4-hydroxy-2-oxoglutarate aldolase/2-dehydro-3-deoxy-phosphogluconate aldolase [Thermoanaer